MKNKTKNQAWLDGYEAGYNGKESKFLCAVQDEIIIFCESFQKIVDEYWSNGNLVLNKKRNLKLAASALIKLNKLRLW